MSAARMVMIRTGRLGGVLSFVGRVSVVVAWMVGWPSGNAEPRETAKPPHEVVPGARVPRFEPPRTVKGASDTGSALSHSRAANERRPLRLRFVGDVVFGRYTSDGFRDFGLASRGASDLHDWLRGDLVLANLETPVVSTLPPRLSKSSGSYFGANRQMLGPIALLGFTHLGLANNHTEDLGAAGLEETPEHVRAMGLAPIGRARSDAPYIRFERISVRGQTLQLLAVTTLKNLERSAYRLRVPYVPVHELSSTLVPLIQTMSREAFVIVFVHWGQEDEGIPGVRERKAAHAMVDAGADLVVGHHPHVLQPIELYSGVLIAYSLGNFIFDSFAPRRRMGGILALDFNGSPLCDARVTFVPTRVDPSSVSAPALADEATASLALSAISRRSSLDFERPAWTREGNRFLSDLRYGACRMD